MTSNNGELARQIEERLVDYDGSQISDACEPRVMFSCGELRKIVSALSDDTQARALIAFTLDAIGYDGKSAPFTDRADQVEVILRKWKEKRL